jgi:hypothetical protein
MQNGNDVLIGMPGHIVTRFRSLGPRARKLKDRHTGDLSRSRFIHAKQRKSRTKFTLHTEEVADSRESKLGIHRHGRSVLENRVNFPFPIPWNWLGWS